MKLGDFVNSESSLPAKAEQRIIGKIIKVSEEGWGFISSKDIKFTRIFFHWTSLKQDTLKFTELKSGMKVEFTPVEVQDKGWRAIRIRVIPSEKKQEEPVDKSGTLMTILENLPQDVSEIENSDGDES